MTNLDSEQISLFRSLFNTRTDVYAKYWQDFSNQKSGYAPIFKLNNQLDALTDEILLSHLQGHQIIGVYPLFPDNTTRFLAIDFDGSSWFEIIQKVTSVSLATGIPCYVEKSKSGSGGHLWFFFEENIPAFKARQLGKYLLNKAGITNRRTFDRMFPSQDEHTGKGFGNLICLPLQGKLVAEDKTVFINSNNHPFANQWEFLSKVEKINPIKINAYLNFSTQTPTIVSDNSTEEPEEIPIITTQGQETKLTLNSGIFIPSVWLPDKLYRFLKKELNFPNPEFYSKQRFGYSTWQTPRFLKTLEVSPVGVIIPIGFLPKLNEFTKKEKLISTVNDERISTQHISFPAKLELRKEQKLALTKLLKFERVIFEAEPGFGKTMVALALMKKRSQKTLIIVHTNTLLHQWHKRISDFLSLKKDDVGLIGNNKWSIGKKVTVASYMTLLRRGMDEIKNSFGLVIVDECHHIPANTFSSVVKQISAKYALGLTATSFRQDKLEKLMYFYLSNNIVKVDRIQAETAQFTEIIETQLITRKTQFSNKIKIESFQKLAELISHNSSRNNQISDDIVQVLSTGAKCLVLTERLDHCQILLDLVRQKIKGIQGAIATGTMTKNQRLRVVKRIHQEKFQLLIATGKLVGEGFDWPEVSHLFLVFPFSWKGKLIQYIGRVQRPYNGKILAVVHDYFDDQVSMLKIMYFKRLRTYRNLGLVKDNILIKKIYANKNQLSLF